MLCPGPQGGIDMANQKHLKIEERSIIEAMLNERSSFTEIGKVLGKDRTTVSKEVRSHLIFRKTGYKGNNYNACAHRFSCDKHNICSVCRSDRRFKLCRRCFACNKFCPDFVEVICPKLLKKPYVCNGCGQRYLGCTLEKRFYFASDAHREYSETLSEARSGFSLTEDEFHSIDEIVSPLIKQGQSPHHIFESNKDSLIVSERSIYRLVDACALSARNIDLPRKVRFKPRSNPTHFKVDKSCRIGRSYPDFLNHMEQHPDTPVTELDSVIGTRGSKVLLTIHFVKAEFMLAFLRERNDSASVIAVFEHLYDLLGHDDFSKIFRVCLTDNGTEFSNPTAIEYNDQGERRTRIFYCDPSAPFQKGSAERNHEFIRMFIPKGTDFSSYSQDQISLMMNHINSYGRESLGNRSPYEMFAFLYGQNLLDLLKCHRIPSRNVTLNKSVFDTEVQP